MKRGDLPVPAFSYLPFSPRQQGKKRCSRREAEKPCVASTSTAKAQNVRDHIAPLVPPTPVSVQLGPPDGEAELGT